MNQGANAQHVGDFGTCSCSDPECGRYGCRARRPPAMYAQPTNAFSLDPDRNARATETLAAAINRLAAALEAAAADTSALQPIREAS